MSNLQNQEEKMRDTKILEAFTKLAEKKFKEQGRSGFARILDFPFGIKAIQKYFDDRAFSQVSEELANAMTSEKGIDALLDLAQNWKDPNAAIGYLRALTIGTGQL